MVDNSTYTLPSNGFVVPKGFKFVHWQIGQATYNAGTPIELHSATTEVTAIWEPIEYTITIIDSEKYGATNDYGISVDVDQEDDTKFTATYTIESSEITLVTISAEGKTFEGWVLVESENEDITEASGEETVTIQTGSTGDKIYKAKWTTP